MKKGQKAKKTLMREYYADELVKNLLKEFDEVFDKPLPKNRKPMNPKTRLSKILTENPKGVKVWAKLAQRERCFFCKKKIRPIVPRPGKFVSLIEFLNPEWMVHCQQTHGYPLPTLAEMICDMLEIKEKQDIIDFYGDIKI